MSGPHAAVPRPRWATSTCTNVARGGPSSWAWRAAVNSWAESARAQKTPTGGPRAAAARAPRGQLDPLGVEVQSVLLGHDERQPLLGNRRRPTAEPHGGAAIRVAVAGAEPEPLDALERRRQRERHADARQVANRAVDGDPLLDPHPTFRVRRPVACARSARRCRCGCARCGSTRRRVDASPRRRRRCDRGRRCASRRRASPDARAGRIVVVSWRTPQRQLRPPDRHVAGDEPVLTHRQRHRPRPADGRAEVAGSSPGEIDDGCRRRPAGRRPRRAGAAPGCD